MAGRDRLDGANSANPLVLAMESSRSVAAAQSIADSLRDAGNLINVAWRSMPESTAYTTTRSIGRRVESATDTSGFVHGLWLLGQWGKNSFLYRWLTREPTIAVVVINLQETKTIGPFLALLDRIAATWAPSIQRSYFLEMRNALGQAVRSAPIRVLSLIVLIATGLDIGVRLLSTGFEPVVSAMYLLVIGVAAIGTQVTLSWTDLRETRPVHLVARIFTPPEVEQSDGEDAYPEQE